MRGGTTAAAAGTGPPQPQPLLCMLSPLLCSLPLRHSLPTTKLLHGLILQPTHLIAAAVALIASNANLGARVAAALAAELLVAPNHCSWA